MSEKNSKEMLSARLKKIRKAKNYSRTKLAKECGISDSMVFNYENGTCFPSEKTLKKLARGLGVSVSELVPEMSYMDMRPRPDDFEKKPAPNSGSAEVIPPETEEVTEEEAEDADEDFEREYQLDDYDDDYFDYGEDVKFGPDDDAEYELDDEEPKRVKIIGEFIGERENEIQSGGKTTRFVKSLMDVTHGLVSDPFFIAAEQLLLETCVGYTFAREGTMTDFSTIEQMLEPYVLEHLMYSESGFATSMFNALKSQLEEMPELKDVFLSCRSRIKSVKDFMNVYGDTVVFCQEAMDE